MKPTSISETTINNREININDLFMSKPDSDTFRVVKYNDKVLCCDVPVVQLENINNGDIILRSPDELLNRNISGNLFVKLKK